MTTLDTIRQLADSSGYIHTSDIVQAGIRKEILRRYLDEGALTQEARGIYLLADSLGDEFVLLQKRCKKGIYSHGTALYLHGLTDRSPLMMTLTVPQNYNVYYLQQDLLHVQFKRIKPAWWPIGIAEKTSPQGGTIRLYDKERCICDIIRDRAHIDPQIFSQAMKDYFASPDLNPLRLMTYARTFNIAPKVQDYIEVLL